MDRPAQVKSKSLADAKIMKVAIVDSFRKLNPRTMVKNPVMFVVEVGAVLTSIQLVRDAMHHSGEFVFGLQITLWLWFTVLFANFAEAMAEGRGKAQAETLRKARAETDARRVRADGT
ncbi:MAG: potassium-transporting ATPase subunit B, partial [Candidatus Acidiferrum sp.]